MTQFQIVSFYKFFRMPEGEALPSLRDRLRSLMRDADLTGTVILAGEGFNAVVCGEPDTLARFIPDVQALLGTSFEYKSSLHEVQPFRRVDVKIKPEIVTLKREVFVPETSETHVGSDDWNRLISDPETFVLDARNDYEHRTGSFRGAVNPQTQKFSELPDWVSENLDRSRHKRIAMFCTGGIRCEKFTPYLQELGFREVYQLEGGILKYLEQISPDQSLWQGECFVFDDRVTLDHQLRKGRQPDLSLSQETGSAE